MWRLRAGIVLVIFAGMLIFGGVVAHGGWYWNSKIDVEGVQLRTIWEVTDQGDYVYYYTTDFQVTVPKNATATVVEQAANETVAIAHQQEAELCRGWHRDHGQDEGLGAGRRDGLQGQDHPHRRRRRGGREDREG